ncbi:hypothetical protein N7495_004498 [Penicillium taxi]|uniref:uncharacterized protein n=1 Tax=Penicillium taxi TaxID=168475 RepID=UPI00254541C4|nr:uncharacterized protein N7495_004498 [Penicillium taxi]KAJ5899754.1 hypothetical protein N7495_004498 [Penicillium taxi]
MSQPREPERDHDTEMATSYASRPPANQSQTLPSFRELLPAHLHDEIDSSPYFSRRQHQHQPSQDRRTSPHSGHMASDPRSIPGSHAHHAEIPYGEHHHEYTTRSEHHLSRRLENPARGPSPILPPIRDLQMSDRPGYDNRMGPRPDLYAHDYRPQQHVHSPMDHRGEHYSQPMMHSQYGHPGMPYQHDPEQISMSMSPPGMALPQANFGIMGDAIDPKSKRRRGNLPKPVTDILRAWFHEHLDHPYPSEEDKQMFMTRTNLSISQISNWFINARRRQLPALRNQMRSGGDAESRNSPFSDVDQETMHSPHH